MPSDDDTDDDASDDDNGGTEDQDHEDTVSATVKLPPRARHHAGGPRPDGQEETRKRLHEIEREFAEIFYEFISLRRAATGVDGKTPESAPLTLKLHLDNPALARNAAPASFLEAQLRRKAEEIADRSAVFPTGKVYCYWCRSFDCSHGEPETARQAFSGYSPTGQPGWNELTSILLDRKDPRIDLLHRSTRQHSHSFRAATSLRMTS